MRKNSQNSSSRLLCFPRSSVGKESTCNTGDPSSIPESERSAGEGKGYPLQYSGLENSMDSTVHGVAKNLTRLGGFHFQDKYGEGDVRSLRTEEKE